MQSISKDIIVHTLRKKWSLSDKECEIMPQRQLCTFGAFQGVNQNVRGIYSEQYILNTTEKVI